MATETTTQIIQENPEIEARRLALLDAVAQFTNTNLANMPPPPIMRPAYQVAGLSELQQEAAVRAREGLGAYEPYLQSGQQSLEQAQALSRALGMQGLQSAYGATGAAEGLLNAAAQTAAAQRGAQTKYLQEAAAGLKKASKAGAAASKAASGKLGAASKKGFGYADAAKKGLTSATDFGYDVYGSTSGDLSRAAETGMRGVEEGYGYLTGAGGMFDPSQIAPFMNPYEQQVVQQAMADIRREGEIREQGLQAQAAASGAFGGSRQAVAEQELARNVMEEQARTGGQLRMAGYQQAAQQAQQAFEQERQRRLQQAQLASGIASTGAGMALEAARATGQLGLQAAGLEQAGASQGAQLGLQAAGIGTDAAGKAGQLGMQSAGITQAGAGQLGALGAQYGQLAQGDINQMINLGQTQGALGQAYSGYGQAGTQLGAQLGQLGMQQGALGQAMQQAQLRDVQTLEALGGRDQALQQAILDAQRKTNEQLYAAPYEQYAFLSDIYKGTPSSQQVTQVSQSADPSTAQQIAGLGISGLSAAAGAKQMELF